MLEQWWLERSSRALVQAALSLPSWDSRRSVATKQQHPCIASAQSSTNLALQAYPGVVDSDGSAGGGVVSGRGGRDGWDGHRLATAQSCIPLPASSRGSTGGCAFASGWGRAGHVLATGPNERASATHAARGRFVLPLPLPPWSLYPCPTAPPTRCPLRALLFKPGCPASHRHNSVK